MCRADRPHDLAVQEWQAAYKRYRFRTRWVPLIADLATFAAGVVIAAGVVWFHLVRAAGLQPPAVANAADLPGGLAGRP
jgi:hypothetical protein